MIGTALKEKEKTELAVRVRGRLLRKDPNLPVQLTLPAKDAALLAYLTDEFARSLAPDSDEGDQLVDSAAAISNVLHDCLLARGGV